MAVELGCLLKKLGLIALIVFSAVTVYFIANASGSANTYEPPFLLPILNTVLLSLVCFVVAYISANAYLAHGSLRLLLIGTGMLIFGATSMVAGWLIGPGGPNVNVTIYNSGVLASALVLACSAFLATSESDSHVSSRGIRLGVAYVGGLLVIVFLTVGVLLRVTPLFFVQGVGPTLLRQIVLGAAIALLAASGLFVARTYLVSRSAVLYWYSLGLLLVALGLGAVFFQKAVGSELGWVGRITQYLGGISLLGSVLAARIIEENTQLT
jgi:hypothetical protein